MISVNGVIKWMDLLRECIMTMTQSNDFPIIIDDVLHMCMSFLCWHSISKILLVNKQFYTVGIHEMRVDYIRFLCNYLECKSDLKPSFTRVLRIPAPLKKLKLDYSSVVKHSGDDTMLWDILNNTNKPLRPIVSSVIKELLKCEYCLFFHSDSFSKYLSSMIYLDYRVFPGRTDYPDLRKLSKRRITKNKWTLKCNRWYKNVTRMNVDTCTGETDEIDEQWKRELSTGDRIEEHSPPLKRMRLNLTQ